MNKRLINYNPKLKILARKLRNDNTKSEILLWQYLKGKRMKGFDFHRQNPIDNYIVDFFCNKMMLSIELDGVIHHNDEKIIKDKMRDERLNKIGIKVPRFDDKEV